MSPHQELQSEPKARTIFPPEMGLQLPLVEGSGGTRNSLPKNWEKTFGFHGKRSPHSPPQKPFGPCRSSRGLGSMFQSPVWAVVYGCFGTVLSAAIKFFHPGKNQKC